MASASEKTRAWLSYKWETEEGTPSSTEQETRDCVNHGVLAVAADLDALGARIEMIGDRIEIMGARLDQIERHVLSHDADVKRLSDLAVMDGGTLNGIVARLSAIEERASGRLGRVAEEGSGLTPGLPAAPSPADEALVNDMARVVFNRGRCVATNEWPQDADQPEVLRDRMSAALGAVRAAGRLLPVDARERIAQAMWEHASRDDRPRHPWSSIGAIHQAHLREKADAILAALREVRP